VALCVALWAALCMTLFALFVVERVVLCVSSVCGGVVRCHILCCVVRNVVCNVVCGVVCGVYVV
jgi:hypothetical protein